MLLLRTFLTGLFAVILKCLMLVLQIRVHLQYIGYPIANDALYLSEHHMAADGRRVGGKSLELAVPDSCGSVNSDNKKDEELMFKSDPMCTNCPNLGPKG